MNQVAATDLHPGDPARYVVWVDTGRWYANRNGASLGRGQGSQAASLPELAPRQALHLAGCRKRPARVEVAASPPRVVPDPPPRTRTGKPRKPRDLPPDPPGQPHFANRGRPGGRRAKGRTLEELLTEW